MSRISIFLLLFVLSASLATAEVEWQIDRNIKLPSAPIDVTTSADGQRIFVLLKGGEVQVFDASGKKQETINFGSNADRIVVSPDGERLLLSDSKGKQVNLVSLDFVKPIDIAGSPFKGPTDAKVVVAVYSDFQ